MKVIVRILILIALLAPVQAQVQEEGLVAEWHFDEGAGNVVTDSSGNGYDGTVYGATWVDGKYGKALLFDGVDDRVKLPNSAINGLADITSEFWIKTYDNVAGIITGAKSGTDNEYLIYWDNTNQIYPHIKDKRSAISTSTITDDNWHHVTIVRAGIEVRVYVDGNFNGVANAPTGPLNIDLNGLWLGGEQDSVGDGWETNQQFNGILDEVRIYNRALTAEEIKLQYESGPTALSVTKAVSPQSIKQGQTSTITLTVKNTGSTEISDIEIADTIPSYLAFIEGETSKRYESLAPKDSRQISYTLQFNDAGTFNLEPAIATYANDKGNYKTVESKPASIEVIRSMIENSAPTPKPTNGNVNSASVNLHGEKTDVELGEDVLLKLSAVNIIGNPIMHVQVIIIPPSGWSVTSSEFAKSGAGQYSTTYELESGGGKDIEVRIVPNQIGDDFKVEGRIIYYFGDDVETREDHTLDLPIKVRARSSPVQIPEEEQSEEQSAPGFTLVIGVLGLVAMALYIKRK